MCQRFVRSCEAPCETGALSSAHLIFEFDETRWRIRVYVNNGGLCPQSLVERETWRKTEGPEGRGSLDMNVHTQ